MSIMPSDNILKVVENYIHELRKNGDSLPERNGKLNATAVAVACGIDRGRLYTNPKVKILVNEAVKELGLRGMEPMDINAESGKATLERKISFLESRNAALVAEIHELRRKLEQYRHIDAMLAEGRRVA